MILYTYIETNSYSIFSKCYKRNAYIQMYIRYTDIQNNKHCMDKYILYNNTHEIIDNNLSPSVAAGTPGSFGLPLHSGNDH